MDRKTVLGIWTLYLLRLSGSWWRKQSPENKVWILEPDKRWIQIHSGARVACDLAKPFQHSHLEGAVCCEDATKHPSYPECLPPRLRQLWLPLLFASCCIVKSARKHRRALGTMPLPHFSAALFRWVVVPLRASDVLACETGRFVRSSPQSGSCGPQGQQRAAPGAVWR